VPQRVDLTLVCRTVAEELAFGPRQAGLARGVIRERVETAARLFHIDAHLGDPPQALSQGQRVRTAIAAALTTAPRLLLLDEPTTGQDHATMQAIMETLAATIGKSGGPEVLIFSTHDLRIAARHADRVLVLGDGSLIADVSAEQFRKDVDLQLHAGLRRRN
jgi:energy-coupling factor transport system ATP-binding protein